MVERYGALPGSPEAGHVAALKQLWQLAYREASNTGLCRCLSRHHDCVRDRHPACAASAQCRAERCGFIPSTLESLDECSQRQLEYGHGLLDLMLDAPGTPRWKRLKRIAAI
jgi:hypothetical protein